MGKRQNAGKAKKVVVLGVGPEYQALYQLSLGEHNITFATSAEEALTSGMNADVVVVNIDKHGSFLGKMFGRVSDAKVVAIATSRKLMNKLIDHPSGGKITPVCFHTAPAEITRLLAV